MSGRCQQAGRCTRSTGRGTCRSTRPARTTAGAPTRTSALLGNKKRAHHPCTPSACCTLSLSSCRAALPGIPALRSHIQTLFVWFHCNDALACSQAHAPVQHTRQSPVLHAPKTIVGRNRCCTSARLGWVPASLQRMLPQGAARCSGTRTCVVLSRPPRCRRVLGPHQKTIVSSMEPMHCTMLALMSCPTLSSSRFLASILPAAHTKQQHTKPTKWKIYRTWLDGRPRRPSAHHGPEGPGRAPIELPPAFLPQQTKRLPFLHSTQAACGERATCAAPRALACLGHHSAVERNVLLLHHCLVVLACSS